MSQGSAISLMPDRTGSWRIALKKAPSRSNPLASRPSVGSVIAGATRPDQVEANAAAPGPEGIDRVEDELGIDHALTVAAGDGLNDIEMIEWAAHAIVMGQAKDELKVLASVVTDPVEDDGLAVALVDHFDLDPAVLDTEGSTQTRP